MANVYRKYAYIFLREIYIDYSPKFAVNQYFHGHGEKYHHVSQNGCWAWFTN